jgi:hypothetical protein
MPGAFFTNENTEHNLAARSNFKVAIDRIDPGGNNFERGITLPWILDKRATWQYYDCWIEEYLDAGMVVHRQLPQSNYTPDSLGNVNVYDGQLDVNTALGVNTKSNGSYTDTVQRMANSRYWFCLKGTAIRVGYQVPIPNLVGNLAGAVAVPMPMTDQPEQFAYNKVVANYCGIPVFLAEWQLWYTLAAAPSKQVVPPPNLAAHIRADAELPTSMQVPMTFPDRDSGNVKLDTMIRENG